MDEEVAAVVGDVLFIVDALFTVGGASNFSLAPKTSFPYRE